MLLLIILLLPIWPIDGQTDCFPWDSSCLDELISSKNTISALQSLPLEDAVKLTFDVIDNMKLKDPYKDIVNGQYYHSLYIDYSKGKIITELNYTLQDGYTLCRWAYRIAIYQTQLTFTKFLNYTDKVFLSRLLGYNNTLYPYFNATLNCLNPLYEISITDRILLNNYVINYSMVPEELKTRYFKHLSDTINLELNHINNCIEQVEKHQERIQAILIGCLTAGGAIIAAIIGRICCCNNKEVPKDPQSEESNFNFKAFCCNMCKRREYVEVKGGIITIKNSKAHRVEGPP